MSYASCSALACTIAMAVLGLLTLLCLLRAVIGPSTADRLVAVNMIGTQVICLICLLAARNGEDGFADVALVYAMLSFLVVAVLTRILGGREKRK